MLAERPLEQISVEDIADQAGVSRGLLFHYFASKSEFHLAIVRHSSEQMLQRTEPSESDDPMLTLRSVLASYVDYVTENRNTYVSLLRGDRQRGIRRCVRCSSRLATSWPREPSISSRRSA